MEKRPVKRRRRGLGSPAAAAASNPEVVKATKDVVINMQTQAQSTARVLITATAAGVTGWFLLKKYKDWRRQNYVEKNAHLPDVQAAMIMRKAMFRVEFDTFPFNWITIPDGTNENLLYQLALKVTNVQNVVKAYKVLFDANLYVDVASELKDTELVQFFENIRSKDEYQGGFNPDGTPKSQTPYKAGQTLLVKNPQGTTIYKAEEFQPGKYRSTGEARNFMVFGEEIGDIIKVYVGQSGQYYYLVDVSWSADWLLGHGWVAHTEVKPKY